jgi:hypothetical protein
VNKLLLSLLVVSAFLCRVGQSADMSQLDDFIKAKDYLGLRVYLRKNLYSKKFPPQQWLATRGFITKHITDVGYDILYAWDRATPAAAETKRVLNMKNFIEKADQQLLAKDFAASFNSFQKVAVLLKSDIDHGDEDVARSAAIFYPYVLESMGRSLYGLRRFKESAEVLSWINFSYPRYRRVLFEQMWASFQAGSIDQTLGRIASQFSAHFAEYNSPEAFLVQAYVHKKLCRDDDLKAVIAKMKNLRDAVKKGTFTWNDWVKSDIEGIVLSKVLEANPSSPVALVTDAERAAEKLRIEKALKGAFAREKPQWLDNMETAIAYAQLSTGKTSQLKPIEKLPSRAELFKQKLEIWPADSREEWIDEIGSHRFVGESQCTAKN